MAGRGRNELEIDILGEPPDQFVSLGQARATGKDGLQIAKGDGGDGRDQLGSAPVLLDEGRVDSEFGGNRLNEVAIRKFVQTK